MIGIVGGVGPIAGLDIVSKIIEETNATSDQEHLPLLLSSQPHRIADRTEFLLGTNAKNPAYAMAEIILELEQGGATVIGIPCNTAHVPDIYGVIVKALLDANSNIRLLHIVEEAANYVKANVTGTKVGVLSTNGTRKTGLYKSTLEASGLEVIEPDDDLQNRVHAAIYDKTYGIKSVFSPVSNRAREEILHAITQLKHAGAQSVILGCTELPLAVPEKESSGLTVIDPNRILARALIREIDEKKLKTY